MGVDVISEFTKQLTKIPAAKKEIDILIISRGGDPTVSWRIISLLRERFSKVGILLPFEAFSAATLLALGGDEILMHPFSNLGPVDPQLSYKKQGTNEVISFGAEDLRNYLDFIRKDVGISDQEQLQRSFEMIGKEVGAIPIGIAKRSSILSLRMGEKLLSLHMKDQNKVKAIAEALNRSFYHHGYALGRKEAKEIGLPVKDTDGIEDTMWNVWTDIEQEMQCNVPFNPLSLVLSDPHVAPLLEPTPVAQIPSNLPANLLQAAYQQILQNLQVVSVPAVGYETFIATLESPRCRSEFRASGRIFATKKPDLKIDLNLLQTSAEWQYIE